MNASSNQDIFDVRKIRRLVELMKEHDLGEIDLQQGEVRIQLRRAGVATTVACGPSAATVAAPAPAGPPAPESAGRPAPESAGPSAAEEKTSGNFIVIKSPMVGTFYAAADPDSPPYVKVGDHVGPETTVCIVEAMKVFNQIPAEVSGRIAATLVENGESVEFGQPLFKVDTRE
jgi:acetyl-CoA carboxylase biotin carboxyl carrier protein